MLTVQEGISGIIHKIFFLVPVTVTRWRDFYARPNRPVSFRTYELSCADYPGLWRVYSSLTLRFCPVYSCIYNSQSSLFAPFIVIVSGKFRHTFALSPRQRRSRLFTKIYAHDRAKKTFKHQGGGRVLRLQALLFPQADDAPGYPDVQADGQTVLLQEGGSGRFPHGCPYLLTGRNRGGSQPLHRRTEVNSLFIHIKKQM